MAFFKAPDLVKKLIRVKKPIPFQCFFGLVGERERERRFGKETDKGVCGEKPRKFE